MAPIEVFFGLIVLIFILIGLVRGFLKELGVTLALMFLFFFLDQFDHQLMQGLDRVKTLGQRLPGDWAAVQTCLFIFVISAVAFVSYQGETLAYGGRPLTKSQAIVLGALTGAINGYLIAGGIWYYMDKFGYPLRFLGFSADRLSPFARTLITFLPHNFLGQPLLFGQSLLLFLSMLLLLARIIR